MKATLMTAPRGLDVLTLSVVAAAPMLVHTRHRVQWKVIGAIILAACVTVPRRRTTWTRTRSAPVPALH